ncbi:hypothetical protein SAMN05444365_103349 [Micromonospora pattaloongensis]|uniref:Uncharacterized protein n=1 Tax=Micromonospora pattaloongensis TaxID=405436 RepID=A0A1H3MEQ9_9ACTN|nr:hypothetical protein [Micromonospora pattaloongensis]SDY75126.1 hypothetical protein SAMN05444365_103349 [Micromonospora pattaloongensis]
MKRHRTDGVSLAFAVIFLAMAAWWTAAQLVHLELPAVGWFVACGLIVIGMFGLLGALRSSRSPAGAEGATPEATPASGTAPEDAPRSGAPAETG